MSNFGGAQEAGEGFENKLYTGVENFRVKFVNPTHDELKKIYGDRAKEPTYTSTTEGGAQQIRIDFYLENEPEEGEDLIKPRLTYFITKEGKESQTGKTLCINAYGQNTWLEDPAVIPSNMTWFLNEGIRPAYSGEPALIEMLRNLLNLPGPDKADDKSNAKSEFSESDWNTFFSGNISALRNIALSSPNKIGVLLGVKTADDGKIYQDTYNKQTLRQWAKKSGKFDYLRKDLSEAQSAGAYGKTNFGNPDFVLREFTGGSAAPTNSSAFDKKDEPATSFFAGNGQEDFLEE